MSDDDLLRILNGARKHNSQNQITGFLVYRNGIFLQVLEGEERELNVVWEIILADSRHDNILELSCKSIAEREFADWAMGFVNMSQQDLSHIAGYSEFMNENFKFEEWIAKPGEALELLLDIKHCELS